MKELFIFIVCLLISYLLMSVFTLDLNILNWSENDRIILIIMGIFFRFLYLVSERENP